ncbi:lysophospholipid acyltransferase family protein [Roseospirillum parvum]|uniref:DUF374 domain-containing protein n=1 Tax=Roseospirillum parvum TaxID=83401 RepID=A0A1G7UKA8_9PROT|nr:lysophospholipid acyltransferase family protein [Roseospirillum parvum]SDG47923.1 hypothetical protein SAMN05421742_101355 [Roseospirillum parvum]
MCWLGSLYIRAVWASGRWSVEGDQEARRLWAEGRPFILAFWHGRLLMMPMIWDHAHPIHMLISQHRDGQFIARTVAHFGIQTVAGSSSKGGAAAVRRMVRVLKDGGWVGITPDGPRGPRQRADGGAVALARLTGAPILPASFSARRGTNLGSWDRFLVAFPFTRGVLRWGTPIRVPADADAALLVRKQADLEDEMNRLLVEADRDMGRPPIPPAEGSAP